MVRPYRYVRACAWSGLILLAATVLFWGVLGRNIPPISPALDAEAFAAELRRHAPTIRIGMILQLPFSVLYLVWGVAISKVMERVEEDNNVLSTLQIWGAGFTTVVFVVPCAMWLTLAYRPEVMDPRTLQILYDFAWFFFDMAYSLTTLQTIAIGICFLSDKRPQPLVPAWVAWLTMWVGISFVLETMMPLVTDGPFARNGLLNYWVEFSLFFLMMLVLSIYILKAITRLELEHRETGARA
ncbi:DUF4386 family protein [Sphingomonas sp. ID0503]|uniref:DUF4386 family protein n=1 Tax=Sphingomonas sp. ID0503 TaxID=3399691 RepID=UPI003AFA89D8